MKRLAALLLSLGLGVGFFVACGSSSGGWVKPGATEQETSRDTLKCLTDSSFTVPGGPMGPRQEVNQDLYRRCMTDKGYTAGPAK